MEDWEVGAQAMEVRLQQELFRQQEQGQPHSPYEHELPILDCVRRGSYKVLEGEVWAIPPMGRIGTMSLDATQQRLYEFVTWATMVTRFAVEGGLDVETAYTLSDLYIQMADQTKETTELDKMQKQMTWHFAYKVAQRRNSSAGYSKPVAKAVDYLLNHLHQSVTLSMVAEYCSLSPQYLCSLFEKETGSTIVEFLNSQRVAQACVLLSCSEMQGVDISNYLGFGSQSYFIQVFKKQTGCTPHQYRRKNFRKHWTSKP